MWPSTRRRQRHNNNQHNSDRHISSSSRKNVSAPSVAVGTEAKAIENISKNSKAFNYPAEGFINRIEHSLTYNMISEGGRGVYPEDVVLKQISEEDFKSYLFVATNNNSKNMNNNHGNISKNKDAHGEGGDDSSRHDEDNADNDEDMIVSYAQLSAILALSLQKYPPPREDYEDQQSRQSVPQKLCKAVLQCVVRYATRHDLDRQREVGELLKPVEAHFAKRNDAAQFKNALPFYIGYTATLITANPLPMLVGVSIMGATGDAMIQEQRNMMSIAKHSSRMADVETTGLLDEAEDDF
jgi:hypothetical protein